MRKDYADKWVAALRSGKYTQTTDCLGLERKDNPRCCLGVLCDLVPDVKITKMRGGKRGTCRVYNGVRDTLPDEVLTAVGMTSCVGTPGDSGVAGVMIKGKGYDSLAEANDRGVPFADIADWIEENYNLL